MRSAPRTMVPVLALVVLAFGGCSPTDTLSTPAVTSISIAPHPDTLRRGDAVQLSAAVETSDGTTVRAEWASSDPGVANVSAAGLVQAERPGKAWIRAKAGAHRDSTPVVVVEPDSTPSTHTGFHVAPSGSSGGDGTAARPWDLATALDGAGGRVQPGDTVWMHGGTYAGRFRTALAGRPDAYIVFRQAPRARATIDGTLRADGAYLAFWGFEIMQSDPVSFDWYGLQANTTAGRFINLVVHDAGTMGVSFWTPGENAELYGCIVYNNGTHENLDHGVYVHNYDGTKRIEDNVFFNNFARGIQIYAGSSYPRIVNVHSVGNISFNNGTISSKPEVGSNLLINAQTTTAGMLAHKNLLYFSRPQGINIRLGRYSATYNRDVELQDNYVVGGRTVLEMELPWEQAVIRNNTLIGYPESDLVRTGGSVGSYVWSGNQYGADPGSAQWVHAGTRMDFATWRGQTGLGGTDTVVARPGSNKIVVRPNKYEPGRAHIAVVNWEGAAAATVDLSGVLVAGDRFEIRNVQDVFGAPVVSGTYQGGAVSIPMTGVTPPQPRAHPNATPPRTGPHFDTFLLTRGGQ